MKNKPMMRQSRKKKEKRMPLRMDKQLMNRKKLINKKRLMNKKLINKRQPNSSKPTTKKNNKGLTIKNPTNNN